MTETGGIAVEIETFWQNFPNALAADKEGLTLALFPEQPDIILERELRDTYYSTVDVNALSEALLHSYGRTAVLHN